MLLLTVLLAKDDVTGGHKNRNFCLRFIQVQCYHSALLISIFRRKQQMENLEQCREEINRIDRSMAQLFEERMKVAAQIAAYKKENGLPIFMPVREQEKLESVSEKAGSQMAEYIKKLYATIFSLSREYQSRQNQQ
jgi:monofunctional chorismate mutase